MKSTLSRAFTAHPAQVGETYLQHLHFAAGTGVTLIGAGLAALAHGLLPCLFERTASTTVLRLADGMRSRVSSSASHAYRPDRVQPGDLAPRL